MFSFCVFPPLYCCGINFTFCLRHFSSLWCVCPDHLFAVSRLKSQSIFVLFTRNCECGCKRKEGERKTNTTTIWANGKLHINKRYAMRRRNNTAKVWIGLDRILLFLRRLHSAHWRKSTWTNRPLNLLNAFTFVSAKCRSFIQHWDIILNGPALVCLIKLVFADAFFFRRVFVQMRLNGW